MEKPYFKIVKQMKREMNRPLKDFYNKFQKNNGWSVYFYKPKHDGYTRRSKDLYDIDKKWKQCFGKNRKDQII